MSLGQVNQTEANGVKVGRVIGHDQSQGIGTLFVTLLGINGSSFGSDTDYFPAYHAPPFFGYTNAGFNGKNVANDLAYNDTQKSYGMAFVPPDVGMKVLLLQTADSKRWYWIGVIPQLGVNNMVPGIAATGNVDLSPEQKTLYGQTTVLPTAEVNVTADQNKEVANFDDKNKRPLHPLAGFLLDSGLIGDPIRGSHSSGMRRSSVPNVYGISTPGPLDKRAGAVKRPIGTDENRSSPLPVSRLGGSQFVMDDGDERFQRKTPADQGPPEYADTTIGETGDVRIPYGESFRLRTRTGHQILLHNSEDLIYIGNSRGTGWIEISSDGKIDIFAQDSISVHTQQDFNFHAGRDINMEAQRNINIKASGTNTESPDGGGATPDAVGRIHVDAAGNLTTLVGGFKSTKVTKDVSTVIDGSERSHVKGDNEKTVGKDYKLKSSNSNFYATTNTRIRSEDTTHINSGKVHRETAPAIDMNCTPAQVAEPPSITTVTVAEQLSTHLNSVTDIKLPWANKEYQSDTPLESIMKRIPQHEPWNSHENYDPLAVGPLKTDRDTEEE